MQAITATGIKVSAPKSGFSLFAYLDLYKQRRALLKMDADQLSDLGLTKSQALAEAKRPIWDVPAHW